MHGQQNIKYTHIVMVFIYEHLVLLRQGGVGLDVGGRIRGNKAAEMKIYSYTC
jgi:hypothetical protein